MGPIGPCLTDVLLSLKAILVDVRDYDLAVLVPGGQAKDEIVRFYFEGRICYLNSFE